MQLEVLRETRLLLASGSTSKGRCRDVSEIARITFV